VKNRPESFGGLDGSRRIGNNAKNLRQDVNMATEKFETALKKLEDVVRRLEEGDLSLDESLKAFEEGVKQAAFCSSKLNEAEKKVELLLKKRDGSFIREPFKPEE
jgi:exodeoxyribonuclease VII small subunit